MQEFVIAGGHPIWMGHAIALAITRRLRNE